MKYVVYISVKEKTLVYILIKENINYRGDSTIKEEVRRRKMRKFASKQRTIKQTDGSKTETTLSSVDTRGSWPIYILNAKMFILTFLLSRYKFEISLQKYHCILKRFCLIKCHNMCLIFYR